jgi:hypothetical protein
MGKLASYSRLVATILIITLIGAITSPVLSVRAADDVQVREARVEYTFGENLTFSAKLLSAIPPKEASLFYQEEGQANTQVEVVTIAPQGEMSLTLDLSQKPLRPFVEVTYWYRVALQNGGIFTSPQFTFIYEDNRFPWQTLESPSFRLHWYVGDTLFAQRALNVAQAGLQKSRNYLSVPPLESIDIYVYDNAQAMQAALLLSGQKWIVGHAFPEWGVILVSLPRGPEQNLEMERQIPHELMHIILYQVVGQNYAKIPAWLNEGLASATELYPNPDYDVLLLDAYRKNTLLPLASLCQIFPREAASVLLAYAEATSFTWYLYGQFGASGLEKLVGQYANGVDCERGSVQALGSSLSQLETRWRREVFGENTWLNGLEKSLPWLVLLITILAPTAIVTMRAVMRFSNRNRNAIFKSQP